MRMARSRPHRNTPGAEIHTIQPAVELHSQLGVAPVLLCAAGLRRRQRLVIQRDRQREQGLRLHDLVHGQLISLQQRHEYGVHHHEAVEESQQVDVANIVMQ